MRVDTKSCAVYSEQVALGRIGNNESVFCYGVCLFFENSTVCRNVSAMFCFVCLFWVLLVISAVLALGWVGVVFCWCMLCAFNGEFDPGSGRTLAACLTHASRTVRPLRGYTSGERVSNT